MTDIFFLLSLFIFIFGLCVGSFLNVVVYRLEKKESLKGRSFCPHCRHKLSWKDLFPVLSFIFLRGKCRYCHKKISAQYPLVELSTAFVFWAIFIDKFASTAFLITGDIINLIFLFYIASSLIVIFVYDLRHYIIPDKILLPAIVITFLYQIFSFKVDILNLLLGMVIGSVFFLIIFLISRGRWMGFGDVKLAVLMGALLGFPNILLALFSAFFLGAIIGALLMFLKKKNFKSEIPFGPFLIIGTFIAMFYGTEIIKWYLVSSF
jgi:prepilin signal peptidase PulO-like enzyme (type II secretory pathway)